MMTILEDLPTQKLNTSGQQEFLSARLFCGSQNEQESISKLQSDTFLIITRLDLSNGYIMSKKSHFHP